MGIVSVPSVLWQVGGSPCGVFTLLMRSRHGYRLRPIVQLRLVVLRAQVRVRHYVVQV